MMACPLGMVPVRYFASFWNYRGYLTHLFLFTAADFEVRENVAQPELDRTHMFDRNEKMKERLQV